MKNSVILTTGQLLQIFDNKDEYIPIELNFPLQKNIYNLIQATMSLEFHIKNIEAQFQKNQNKEWYENEMKKLMDMSMDVPVIMIPLHMIDDLVLTQAQTNAILFMVDESDEYTKRRKRIMKMTNFEIYNAAASLMNVLNDPEQRFPVKVNFYMQKNKNTLFTLAQDIDAARLDIVKRYGTANEDDTQYVIAPDNVEVAQQELNDLFSLEQEVNIYKVDIDSFPDDISLTASQMEALLFMIN